MDIANLKKSFTNVLWNVYFIIFYNQGLVRVSEYSHFSFRYEESTSLSCRYLVLLIISPSLFRWNMFVIIFTFTKKKINLWWVFKNNFLLSPSKTWRCDHVSMTTKNSLTFCDVSLQTTFMLVADHSSRYIWWRSNTSPGSQLIYRTCNRMLEGCCQRHWR